MSSPSPRTPPSGRRGSIAIGGRSVLVGERPPLSWAPSLTPDSGGENFKSFTIPKGGVSAMMPADVATARDLKFQPHLLVEERAETPSLLPRRGFPATIVQHTSQASSGGSEEILGETVLSQDEHRFVFTVLRGSGTGMRVGVASADGSCNWGFRLFDGRLSQHLPRTHQLQSAAATRALDTDPKELRPKQGLPIALGGAELPRRLCQGPNPWDHSPGLRIEVTVNMALRTLVFHAGNGLSFDAGITLPAEGVRPWFESRLLGDAIAISEHRIRPASSTLVMRQPFVSTRSRTPEARRPLWSPRQQDAELRATSPRRASSPRGATSPSRAFNSSAPRFASDPNVPRRQASTPERGRHPSPARTQVGRSPSPAASRTGAAVGSMMLSSSMKAILQEQEQLLTSLKAMQPRLKQTSSAPRHTDLRSPRFSSPASRRGASPTHRRRSPFDPVELDELQSARTRIAELERENSVLRRQASPEASFSAADPARSPSRVIPPPSPVPLQLPGGAAIESTAARTSASISSVPPPGITEQSQITGALEITDTQVNGLSAAELQRLQATRVLQHDSLLPAA